MTPRTVTEQSALIKCYGCDRVKRGETWTRDIVGEKEYRNGYCPSCYDNALAELRSRQA